MRTKIYAYDPNGYFHLTVYASKGGKIGDLDIWFYKDYAVLDQVEINAKNRRSGVGKYMVKKAEEFIRSKGISRVVISSSGADEFWHHVGYTDTGMMMYEHLGKNYWEKYLVKGVS